MKLNEKIYTCRKNAGMSQEALAEEIGVSRQAVSKWETGEAEPEIRKLQQLAKIFGVSTDWLLSEEKEAPKAPPPPQAEKTATSWIDDLPRSLGRFLRKYGWLAGLYVMIGGLLIMLMGGAAYGISNAMVSDCRDSYEDLFGGGIVDALGDENSFEDYPYLDDFQTSIGVSSPTITVSNPVGSVGIVMMVFGGFIALAGGVLAVVLRRKGKL